MIFIQKSNEDIAIFEFQGVFENLDMFNGTFDPKSLVMTFKDFVLQGKIIKKDFTIFEKIGDEVKQVKQIEEVVFFGQPPRFII